MFLLCFFIHSFAKQFRHDDWKGFGSFIHWPIKIYGNENKAICGTKESATPTDQLEEWKEIVLIPTLKCYSPVISTMVMKQLCSTNFSLIELIARLVTRLLVLQGKMHNDYLKGLTRYCKDIRPP